MKKLKRLAVLQNAAARSTPDLVHRNLYRGRCKDKSYIYEDFVVCFSRKPSALSIWFIKALATYFNGWSNDTGKDLYIPAWQTFPPRCFPPRSPSPTPSARQTLVGLGLVVVSASRSHSDTPQAVGPFWMDDRSDAGNPNRQHSTLTRKRHPCSRQDSNP
jgi:hypothetical protein